MQALYPRRTNENCPLLYVNLDFRVAAPNNNANGMHRFTLGAGGATPAVEILISSKAISLRTGKEIEQVGTLKPNQWYNLQLTLDLRGRKVSGRIGVPGAIAEFSGKPISSEWSGVIDSLR